VRNGSTAELYVDFGWVAKLLVPFAATVLVDAGAGVLLIVGSSWHIFAPAICAFLLALMFPLLLVYARRKPLLLLTPDGVAENVPGGIKIRWNEIAFVFMANSSPTPRR